MNRIAVIVPFYKRPEITKLCFEWLEGQSTRLGFDVFVSGDDKSIVPSSFTFVESDNNHLGRKLNTLLNDTKGYDAVSVIGSDDFVSDSVWEYYQSIDTSSLIYYGLNDLHTYSVWDKKLGNQPSYCLTENTIGVARLWTKNTLEKMNYNLWTPSANKGLDGDSKRNMIAKGIKEITVDYGGHFVLDVKHDLNITDPAIINTCQNFEVPTKLVEVFGEVGQKILSLSMGETRKINRTKKVSVMNKIKAIVKKSFNGLLEGAEVELKDRNFKELSKLGYVDLLIEPTNEEKPKQTRKPRVKK